MSFSISWILPRLALGTAPQTVADAQRAKTLGVTDVLDMRLHPIDNGERVSGAEIYDGTGIRYHSTPMQDNGAQKTVAQYVDAVTFARDALARSGSKLFVFCQAGQYRSPATVYAILRAMGDSPTAAWARITAVRHVYPQYLPGAEASVPFLPRVELGDASDVNPWLIAAGVALLAYVATRPEVQKWLGLPGSRRNPIDVHEYLPYLHRSGTESFHVGRDTVSLQTAWNIGEDDYTESTISYSRGRFKVATWKAFEKRHALSTFDIPLSARAKVVAPHVEPMLSRLHELVAKSPEALRVLGLADYVRLTNFVAV